jgi:hypothetical protein
MNKWRRHDPDGWYDNKIESIECLRAEVLLARIKAAQAICPFFLEREIVEELDDNKVCLYDNKPCEDRRFCPVDKWSAPIR